ncbi:hypothetical protein [Treponema parvum]|uniref:hypothetical protein n=1 Tax=Treponema parvum TaxID=138851 RepID=UPI001AEC08AC|nr:hypothetical protein [Treponema parvum]QTQ17232.1 hypothetical protein HXT04_11340 [Treponema parvum]
MEDNAHRPREGEAEVAWNFFRNFKRSRTGKIDPVFEEEKNMEKSRAFLRTHLK